MNIAADSEDAAPRPNVYIGRDMKQVEIRGVQQAGGRAFFRRGGQWVDSRVAARKEEVKPDDIVLIGSAEHGKLLDRLSTQNSQSILAMEGEILLELDGRVVLVREAEE